MVRSLKNCRTAGEFGYKKPTGCPLGLNQEIRYLNRLPSQEIAKEVLLDHQSTLIKIECAINPATACGEWHKVVLGCPEEVPEDSIWLAYIFLK